MMINRRLWLIVIFLFMIASCVYSGTITVNSLEDTNARDDAITLREAIMLSEGSLALDSLALHEQTQVSQPVGRGITDTINFGISGTIMPISGLPEITDDGTVIDASSWWNQPGLVILDGMNAGNVDGLVISGAANCHIRGLFITGFSAGVLIHNGAQSNTIGGITSVERNIISGNGGSGVVIGGTGAQGNTISGNYIGINANGTVGLGNSSDGVAIVDGARSNIIGGTTAGERNIISRNDGVGILISGSNNNVVFGNYIGTNAIGATGSGNTSDGVLIIDGAQSNTIGGTDAGEGNTVAFNKRVGIYVVGDNTDFNTISGNSIHDNGWLGIDVSEGGNNGIGPPDIIWCSLAGDILTVSGDTVEPGATIEVFRADFLGQEGQTFLGILTVDENGAFSGSLSVAGKDVSANDVLIATITHTNGDTSEYSPPLIWIEYAASPPIPMLVSIDGRKLSVGEGGVLYHDGKPFRAIGVNYNDAFERTLLEPDNTTYRLGFAQLALHGIPFIRFMATTHFAVNLAIYENDRENYLRLLDGVVQAAEDYGIGLVPSFFWQYFTVPDLVGEPVNQWGNSDSKTIAFMRRYTQDIVPRYKDSPAIWAWEFGNEFSLMADLPNAAEHRPPIIPELGTPLTRGPEDDLTTDMIVVAFKEFAEVVRSIDPTRPITTGNSVPRNFAEDIRLGHGWSELDTRDEFKDNVSLVNPSPHNMVSIHLYPEEVIQQRFEPGYHSSYSELISLAMEAAFQEGKSLFVGEFGANDVNHGGSEKVAQINQEMLDALVENGVALAAIWVFNYGVLGSEDEASLGWNIRPPNRRMYLLDAIRDANTAISDKLAGDQSINYPWDVNRDGKMDVSDVVFVARYFGKNVTAPLYLNPDVNGDGTVNILDIILVAKHFGEAY